jgi:hypothetical protein
VEVVRWPPESSAGFRGARPQDRSHGSVVRNGAVTFASARLRRRVFVQSTEPEVVTEKALEGQNPGEHRPGRPWASSGASSRDFAVGRVNGLPRGARLRSGRNGRVPASPKVPVSVVEVVARGNSRGGQAVFTIAGKPRSRVQCLERVSSSRGAASEARTRRAVETGRTARNLRAGDTVDVEPARKQKAVERRHGSSGRESSEGRIPGTSRGRVTGRESSGA